MITRPARCASSRLWVTTMTVIPCRWQIFKEPVDPVRGDRIEVSCRLICKQDPGIVHECPCDCYPLHLATARARPGRCSARCESPTFSSKDSIVSGWYGLPEKRRGRPTFSPTVRVGMRKNCWKTKPICSRRIFTSSASPFPVTGILSIMRVPLLGVSRHPRMFISAVLPAPGWSDNRDELACFNGEIHSTQGADFLAAPRGRSC